MKTNPSIAWSQRFYRWLLQLYPQAYRATYEMEMYRVFTNQCQEIYEQHSRLGILGLWPRTLVDLFVTIVHEHLTDSQAKAGLLEANPNLPLPWKGVLLVLIPGLIFFVSQIAQLTTDTDWFFIAFYRAAYYLIVPVLLIWLLTRQFPIWGLIPFGLLYKLWGQYSPRYLISKLPFFNRMDILGSGPLGPFRTIVDLNYAIPILACTVLICALSWNYARRQKLPPAAWKWLAFYVFLIIFQIVGEIYRMILREAAWQGLDWQGAINTPDVKQYMIVMPFWFLYEPLLFLGLVFIGKLFAQKYGGLSFLLLLGYLLPTIVFGRYGAWNEFLPFYLVSIAVLIYRFVVALLAPVWLVRAASMPKRQRAAVLPVAIAILTHISLNLIAFVAGAKISSYQPSLLDFALMSCNHLMVAAGFALAVVLYLPKEPATLSPPALTAIPE